MINAPAALVFEVARNFDLQSISTIRALFWLRAKLLGAKTTVSGPRRLIAYLLAIGWERLAEEPGQYFVAGAVCQPWKANVTFSPIPPNQFASFSEPDRVKIAWTLEAEALPTAGTRFATETRAAATDSSSRAKFRRYWLKFGIGIVMIRRLLLSALRQIFVTVARFVSGLQNRTPFTITSRTFIIQVLSGAGPGGERFQA
jgi:hypothetical protein